MKFHLFIASIILIIACVCKILTVDIKPELYQKQKEYYNKTSYGILEKEIGLILPTYKNKRNKRFIGTLLGV